MANRWGNRGTVTDFIFLGSKITAVGDWSSDVCSSDLKAVYYYTAYATYIQSTSSEMLGWVKHKLESRLPGEIPISSDMQMTPPLWQKVKN